MSTSAKFSEDLLAAVRGNDLDRFKKILQSGVDPNINRDQSSSLIPLLLAAANGKVEMIKCLLQFKADVEIENGCGSTALHLAAEKGHADALELLISHGADVNTHKNTDGGWTPLHRACCFGQVACVRILLEHGADVALRDSDGETARDWAVDYKRADVVQLLDDHDNETRVKGLRSMCDSMAAAGYNDPLAVNVACSDDRPKVNLSTVNQDSSPSIGELDEFGGVAESPNPLGCLIGDANGRVDGSSADLGPVHTDSHPPVLNDPLAVSRGAGALGAVGAPAPFEF